jgi:hypothetical protein
VDIYHLVPVHGRLRAAESRMAAAVDAEERRALDAKIREVEKELTGANGVEKVALLQLLAALQQQKLLLMQQQSGASGWAHTHQGAHQHSACSMYSFIAEQGFIRSMRQ